MDKTFLERLGAYWLHRLLEPTTYAGFFLIAHALLGWNPSMEMKTAIELLGEGFIGSLFVVAREGRNKPDNPSLPTTLKGKMPAPPAAIVPPTDAGMKPLAPDAKLESDPAGTVHEQKTP